jgi:DNA-binding CsgD family transcriptional regulator
LHSPAAPRETSSIGISARPACGSPSRWHRGCASGAARQSAIYYASMPANRSLVVEFVDGALLLEERQQMPALTAREREVLDLVADGRANAEIAGRLWVSPGTVRKHLENVFAKLGVHTRTAAAAVVRDQRL